MNNELRNKISIWRQRAANGSLTPEEMKEAILALREGRQAAARSTDSARRSRAIKVIPSADDLLKELGVGL